MMEIIVLFAMVLFIAVWFYWPQGSISAFFAKEGRLVDQSVIVLETETPEDSEFRNQFLDHLQHEIEVNLFPRPTDSVLKRHYDTIVAVKLEERLAQMPM